MALRKSPTLTPALLAANRRNAQKSTGPRTARGKAQSRLNGLRDGSRSRFYHDLWLGLMDAPPCSVDKMARALLSPEMAAHPVLAEAVALFRQAEIEVILESKQTQSLVDAIRRNECYKNDEQSRNIIENKRRQTIHANILFKTD